MKRVLILIALLLAPINAHALQIIDVNYTGNSVAKEGDTAVLGNYFQGQIIGGPVGNMAREFNTFEFTVDMPSFVNYLSIDATVVPYNYGYPEDGRYPPLTGPQDRNVFFKLFEGTKIYGSDGHEYLAPDTLILTSDTYIFSSIDSYHSQSFSDFQIPFETMLKPNRNYWIWAEDQDADSSPATFNYSSDFVGRVVPEPSTMLLFGTGLLGAFIRRRKPA